MLVLVLVEKVLQVSDSGMLDTVVRRMRGVRRVLSMPRRWLYDGGILACVSLEVLAVSV
jgi:hypothetical protein